MDLKEGFDDEIRHKLNSGTYNLSEVIRATKVSRYVINQIKRNVYVKPFYLVALREYFKKLGE